MKHLSSIIALFLFLTCCCSCLPGIGEKVTVSEQCVAAFSEENYKEMLHHASNEDLLALQEMARSGKVLILPAGTSATLMATSMERAQIEVQIQGQKQQVWVEKEHLK